jgi:hypothetical protein
VRKSVAPQGSDEGGIITLIGKEDLRPPIARWVK